MGKGKATSDNRRKKIRLDPSLYEQPGTIVFATLTVDKRRGVLTNHALAVSCIQSLEEQATFANVAVLAYCFMPDHMHLLLRVDGSTGIIAFLHAFKTRTARIAWEHQVHGSLWQRSFYDHILREPNEETRALRYIFENPVRSGLVDSWREYPYIGSFTYEFDDDSLWDAR